MLKLIRKLGPEAIRFLSTTRRYGSNPVSAARRYWSLYYHRKFSPDEIHFQRLLDPTLTESDLLCSVSKEELLSIQARLNPQEFHSRTENKIEFSQFCQENQLPTPEIFAIFDRECSSFQRNILKLKTQGELDVFLNNAETDSFILKPVAGVNGEGVMRLERHERHWQDSHGISFDATALHDIISDTPYNRWLFQRVVRGHPALSELSNTSGLQTARVVTVVDENNDVKILAARLRLICGDVAHDNFEFGKTGNVIAILDPSTGIVESAVGGSQLYYEMQSVTHHPRTGRALIGFRVPEWDAVRTLTISAAKKFMPLRSIGWDVGITPGAPTLIEGNVTWATLSGETRMGEIYRHLCELVNVV